MTGSDFHETILHGDWVKVSKQEVELRFSNLLQFT